MSDPGTCSDAVSLGGTGQESEADGDPPHAAPPPPCIEEEAQSVTKQPPPVEGMEVDIGQPDVCTEMRTGVHECQDADGIPDRGDMTVSLHLSVSSM